VLPTAEDVNSLDQSAKSTIDTFFRQSFELRMQYEFSGRFPDQNDKDNLYELAKRAGDRMQAIALNQRRLKKQIEDYPGDDWDARYGSTGLWRKLSADLSTTALSKCEIDFYTAIATDQPLRNKILHNILTEIESLHLMGLPAVFQLLKAKTLALLAQTDPACRPLAKKEFDILMARSDMGHSTAFRISIERIKFLGVTRPGRLETMAENIAKSKCFGDLELILSLAFLQRQRDRDGLEKTVEMFPQIEGIFSSLILADLSTRQDLNKISVFEAQLAAQAAWKNNPQDYNVLLTHLANTKKFQTPLILYVAAVAASESSPARSVTLLIGAGKLLQQKKDDKLTLDPYEIAEQAAQLAYNLFAKDRRNCSVAIDAFNNYATIASYRIDEELEYFYTIVLRDCGHDEKSRTLLQKIADGPRSYWRNRARLDLIIHAVQQKQHTNHVRYRKLLKQLRHLIIDCGASAIAGENYDDIASEAIAVNCQLLLESQDKVPLQEFMDFLDKEKDTNDPELNLFKSKALQRLGKLDESTHYLLKAVDSNTCELTGQIMELLSEVVDTIEQFGKNDLSFMWNCKQLAQLCYDCLDGRARQKAALFLIEISLFSATSEEKKLSGFENMLDGMVKEGLSDNVDFIRCRARLLTKQLKFAQAGRLWAEVCEIRKHENPSPNQRSWKWWRAKYYELYCWSKCPQTQKKSVLHTIEVLENNFDGLPPLWAEKFNSLKQQCRSQLMDASK